MQKFASSAFVIQNYYYKNDQKEYYKTLDDIQLTSSTTVVKRTLYLLSKIQHKNTFHAVQFYLEG